MVKGFEGTLESIRHDHDRLIFIPSADYLALKELHRAECLVGHGLGAKLPVVVSATSSSFEMDEYRACTSILIPTIPARMRRGFDGARTVSGEGDDHPSGGFSFNWERISWLLAP